MNEDDYRKEAEALVGKWIKEKGAKDEASYVYLTLFSPTMNDWCIHFYTFNPTYASMEDDYVYLEDFKEYYREIKESTGLKIYEKFKAYMDKVVYHQKK